ncbi:MAG: DUF87 domain-containing protein, partial [Acidobacteria bacterium]|nr:DUF87 domain-containing protein [Acidobacteriota bacterium]
MSFSTKSAERFRTVIEKSPYSIGDPLVKLQYVQRGNNVIFGRTLQGNDLSNLIYVGKILETTKGRTFLGADAWLDTTFPHVIYITGTRGSGKSFDLGVLVEGISQLVTPSPIQNVVQPIASIIVDTQSQFWTLGYPPRDTIAANEVQLAELRNWNLRPNSLADARIYAPPGTTTFLDNVATLQLRPRDVKVEEWAALLGQEIYSPQGHILTVTLEALSDRDFEVSEMLSYIADETNWPGTAESSRNALTYKLDDYRRTNLFSSKGLAVSELLKEHRCNILALRELRNEDKSLITAVKARSLFYIFGKYQNRKKDALLFEKPYEET